MKTLAKAVRLRLFDGWLEEAAGGGGGHRRSPSSGDPKILGRVNGFPLELRVWRRRPRVAEAVYHPSGVWVAVRVL